MNEDFLARNSKAVGLSLITLGVVWLTWMFWEVRHDIRSAVSHTIEQIQQQGE